MSGVNKPTLQEYSDSILVLLECPVCMKHMKSPIRQCENSHTICSQCVLQLDFCPTCRGVFIGTRCLPLEHLTEKVMLKCEFVERGCNERCLQKDMSDHIWVCPYRSYKCLHGIADNCGWKGKRDDIYAHVALHHDSFMLTPGEDSIIRKALCEQNFTEKFDKCFMISYEGETFWLREICRPYADMFYTTVQYVGPKTTSGAFTYTIDLSNGKVRYLYQSITHCDTESVDDIINSGNCACVSISMIESGAGKANWKYEIQVKRHAT